MERREHEPIMVDEILSFLKEKHLSSFVDGTLGAGGHASKILEHHPEIEQFIGFDRDSEALLIAKKVLAPWEEKVKFVQKNFRDMDAVLKKDKVDGFFLTLGSPLCSLTALRKGLVL